MIDIEERPIADLIDGVPDPSQCQNVLGHDHAFDALFSSYRSGRMHHAWLINGPRGVGKASLANVFAKFMFSNLDISSLPNTFEEGTITETVHRQVAQGAHAELLHLTKPWDEKTKRFKTQLSVDEIRKTAAFYGLTAAAGGWRITIVDAADDMNASAANALLKILEEPPKRSIFFVISHATGRLLPTIRSRCRHLNLKPLQAEQVLQVLNQLNVQASDKDKSRACELAEGSVRRAIQLIETTILKDYDAFEKLLNERASGQASAWVVAHKIADNLSRKGQEGAFELFIELAIGWIGKQVRVNPQATASELNSWAKTWETINSSTQLASAYNLDRKQVILSLFGTLFERNKTL